jgi:hypothetical protein
MKPLIVVLLIPVLLAAQSTTIGGRVTAGGKVFSSGTGGYTIYGNWTGGGSTVTVSDADCSTGDDTSTVQGKFNALSSNDTLDFQNATNPCDIGSAGISRSGITNVRYTTSVTPPAGGTFRGVAAGIYSTDESTLIYLSGCNNCLIDKLKINLNGTKGQAVKVHHSSGFSVQNVEAFDAIYDAAGAPYALLKTGDCQNYWLVANNLHDATGIAGGEGVRGIWAGVGNEYDTTPHILNNTVADTGHTGIVSESQGPVVTGNQITNCVTQGTGMKFVPRGAAADATWDSNTVTNTVGAAMQVDASTVKPDHIYIRTNSFVSCGASPQNFGGFYLSGSTSGGTQNVTFSGNTLNTCRSVGAMNNSHHIIVLNNTITNPQGGDGSNVNIENDNTDVHVTNSGNANVFDGTSTDIWEDDIQIAMLPLRILALVRK